MALRERAGDPSQKDRESLDLAVKFKARLLDEVQFGEVANLELPQRRARLERVLSRILSREGPVMSSRERARLTQRIIDEVVGLGVLEPLVADPQVTEIMVNGPYDVFVERAGRIERSATVFDDREEAHDALVDRGQG